VSVMMGGRRGVRRGGLRVGAVSPVNAGSHTARVCEVEVLRWW
jgi:hypothetical protein